MTTALPARLARGVLVSRHFPADPRSAAAGVFQRLRLQIHALAAACEHVEVVFLLEPDVEDEPAHLAALDDTARAWIGEVPARLAIRIAARRAVPPAASLWRRYGAGVFSIARQTPYAWYLGGRPAEVFAEIVASDPDVLVCHRLDTAVLLLTTPHRPRRVIVDFDDIEHQALWRRMWHTPEWPSERLRLLHVPVLALAEYRVGRRADHVLVASPDGARDLNRLWLNRRATAIPNSIRLPAHLPPALATPAPVCLFLGTYHYGPNVDAATHLVQDIWPDILRARPDARLWLAGPGDEKLPTALRAAPGVSVTGFVEDLAALYRDVALVCCPIRAGSGTRIKIIEAAAYGKAIVSTRLGAEGLELPAGEAIELADGAAAFARCCIALLDDDARRAALGARARATVAERYDQPAVLERLAALMAGTRP